MNNSEKDEFEEYVLKRRKSDMLAVALAVGVVATFVIVAYLIFC